MAAKSAPKASLLSTLANDGALLRLEERLGPGAPHLASNGYSSAADSWAAERSATGPEPRPELRYEAESPDEAALVHAARAYSCALVGRLHDQVFIYCWYLLYANSLTTQAGEGSTLQRRTSSHERDASKEPGS